MMRESLGYVVLDRVTLADAERAREADLVSAVVRHAKVESAADRVRRLRAVGDRGRVLRFQERAQG
jgi:hypothetical protein